MIDFLTSAERLMMQQDVIAITTDQQMQGTVLYQSFISTAQFDVMSGSITPRYAGTWLNVIRTPIFEEEIEVTGGAGVPDSRYQMGNYCYLVSTTDLGMAKKDDRIIDNGITRYVIDYTTDALNVFHSIIVRNLGNR